MATKSNKSGFKKIIDIILWVVLGLITAFVMVAFVARIENPDMPKLGNNYYMSVESESMKGTFNKGDVIVVKSYLDEDRTKFEKDDVITYFAYDESGNRYINTHRVLYVEVREDATYYKTKGDNNLTEDSYFVTDSNVVGEWTGVTIPVVGGIISFIRTIPGFIVCIVAPMGAFLIYQLIDFVRAIEKYKNKDKVVLSKEEEELIKQKAIAEYLAKQKEQENNK